MDQRRAASVEVSQALDLQHVSSWDGDIVQRAVAGQQYVDALVATGRFFYRRVGTSGPGAEVEIIDPRHGGKRRMVCFASNDYLNLSMHPQVVDAGVEAARKYGVGAGSAPVLSGTLDIHLELERRTAEIKSCEDSIVYSSGYAANRGSLLAMLGQRDCAVVDMRAHVSLVEGCKEADIIWFRHNDVASLERKLKVACRRGYATVMVIVDGVYSMDGDICPAPEICRVAHEYGAYVWLDDAHGTGVLGKRGRGTAEHFGIEGEVDIVSGSYSKALGCAGGFVAGKQELVNGLRFVSRPYAFSASLSPTLAGSALAALEVVGGEGERRKRLKANSDYFRTGLRRLGFNTGQSESQIVPVIVGDETKVVDLCGLLHEAGVYVNPVVYPAVPRRASRLRFSVTSKLTKEQLDRCLLLMGQFGAKLGIIEDGRGEAVPGPERTAGGLGG